MGVPEESAARPSSKSSNDDSAHSTLAPSGVAMMSEKAAVIVDPATVKESAIADAAEAKEMAESTNEARPTTAETDDSEEVDDTVYPTFFKVVLITIALMLAVFCMALVCSTLSDLDVLSFIVHPPKWSLALHGGVSTRLSDRLSLVCAIAFDILHKHRNGKHANVS